MNLDLIIELFIIPFNLLILAGIAWIKWGRK